MKAAEMKERPSFTLMKQTDVQSIYHMQMPRWLFSDPRYADMSLEAKVFENAIERLFYSQSFRIGGAVLPQSRVRSRLRLLNGVILQEAENKLHANLDRNIRNSTAYTMATIFNCIAESESGLMVDPYQVRTVIPA